MQIVDCFVRLKGDMRMETPRYGVTVPEIVVLRAIHGADAVVKIRPRGMDKRSHADELARLREFYRGFMDGDSNSIVDLTFSGFNPRLPVKLSEIGLSDEGDPLPEKGETPVRRPRNRAPDPAMPAEREEHEEQAAA